MAGVTEKGGGNPYGHYARLAADHLAGGGTLVTLAEEPQFWVAYCRSSRAIKELAETKKRAQETYLASVAMGEFCFKRWQAELFAELHSVPDVRRVIWYYDATGNSGKTWFAKLMCAKHGAVRFENGKSADVKYAWKGERVVFFDYTRTVEGHVNYEVLESIKNGVFMPSKYESAMKVYPVLHVVMSNFEQERDKLSADTWDVRVLDAHACEYVSQNDVTVKVKSENDIIINDSESDDSDVEEIVPTPDYRPENERGWTQLAFPNTQELDAIDFDFDMFID